MGLARPRGRILASARRLQHEQAGEAASASFQNGSVRLSVLSRHLEFELHNSHVILSFFFFFIKDKLSHEKKCKIKTLILHCLFPNAYEAFQPRPCRPGRPPVWRSVGPSPRVLDLTSHSEWVRSPLGTGPSRPPASMGEEPGVSGRPHLERSTLPGQVYGHSGRCCPASYCCTGRW